jgi:hypothetical protein
VLGNFIVMAHTLPARERMAVKEGDALAILNR